MFGTNFKQLVYSGLFAGIMFSVSSCNKENIVIQPEPEVTFFLTGDLGGQSLSLNSDNIMITQTGPHQGSTVIHEGNLYFNCDDAMLNQCNGSISIQIFADSNSSIDQEIPAIFQVGSIDFKRQLLIPGTHTIELKAVQPENGVTQFSELLFPDSILDYNINSLPVYPAFKEVRNIVSIGSDAEYVENYNILLSNLNGQIVYYYLDLACLDQSPARTTVVATLNTNTSQSLADIEMIAGQIFILPQELRWPPLPGMPLVIRLAAKAPNQNDTLFLDIISLDAQMPSDKSLCASWLTHTIETDSVALTESGHIVIEYTTDDGTVYKSKGMGATDFFEIISFETAENDDFGNRTIRARIKFNALLHNDLNGDSILLEGFEGEFAFGY